MSSENRETCANIPFPISANVYFGMFRHLTNIFKKSIPSSVKENYSAGDTIYRLQVIRLPIDVTQFLLAVGVIAVSIIHVIAMSLGYRSMRYFGECDFLRTPISYVHDFWRLSTFGI